MENLSVIVVGCGGVLFHALPRLVTVLNRYAVRRITLYDPDVVEEENAARQWGTPPGTSKPWKTRAAKGALVALGLRCPSGSIMECRVKAVEAMIEEDLLSSQSPSSSSASSASLVVSVPDMWQPRLDVHAACEHAQTRRHGRVVEAVAGNDELRGWAWCAVFENGLVRGDWLKRHAYALEEANEERTQAALRVGTCARVEQSPIGNQLTAGLLCRGIESGLGGVALEQFWEFSAGPDMAEVPYAERPMRAWATRITAERKAGGDR